MIFGSKDCGDVVVVKAKRVAFQLLLHDYRSALTGNWEKMKGSVRDDRDPSSSSIEGATGTSWYGARYTPV